MAAKDHLFWALTGAGEHAGAQRVGHSDEGAGREQVGMLHDERGGVGDAPRLRLVDRHVRDGVERERGIIEPWIDGQQLACGTAAGAQEG